MPATMTLTAHPSSVLPTRTRGQREAALGVLFDDLAEVREWLSVR